jgi:hypothetical protein
MDDARGADISGHSMDGMQPNFFTINGKAYPATETIPLKVGETLKVRFIGTNNGFIHPMHIHGGPFEVVARDGETIPGPARFLADTVNVGLGQRYDHLESTRARQVAHPLPHSSPYFEQQHRDEGRRRSDGHYRGPLNNRPHGEQIRHPTFIQWHSVM